MFENNNLKKLTLLKDVKDKIIRKSVKIVIRNKEYYEDFDRESGRTCGDCFWFDSNFKNCAMTGDKVVTNSFACFSNFRKNLTKKL